MLKIRVGNFSFRVSIKNLLSDVAHWNLVHIAVNEGHLFN